MTGSAAFNDGWREGQNALREELHAETHMLRCLVAESLEVLADVFVILTHDEDPPRIDLAANELAQAHKRISRMVAAPVSPENGEPARLSPWRPVSPENGGPA